MFEQDGSNMTHEDIFLSLMFYSLNWINHSDILAHLEGCFCKAELQVPEAMLSQDFKELILKFSASFWSFDAIIVLIQSKTL